MNNKHFIEIKTRIFYCLLLLFLALLTLLFISSPKAIALAHEDEVPEIKVDTTEWATSVEVTIEYPSGLAEQKYAIIINSIIGPIKNYDLPFRVAAEGIVVVRAFYGNGAYVEKSINNIDVTQPSEPEIRLEINLMKTQNILLIVQANDNKSGVEKVVVSTFGYEFHKKDSWFELDLTHVTIADTFSIIIYDKVDNRRTVNYFFSAYDYVNSIRNHANLYKSLGDGSQYTKNRWAGIVNKFENLEIVYASPSIDSSEINSIDLQLEELIEGEYKYYTQIVEPILGMDSNIVYAISSYSLDAPLGSEILMEISNSVLTIEEREKALQLVTTLSGYSKVKMLPFNLTLKEKTGEEINLIGSMNIEFFMPEGYTRAKLFGYKDGVYYEIVLATSEGKKSARATSDGDFFLVLDEESSLVDMGYVIRGRFYSYGLFWGVISGIAGLMIVAFVATYLLISNKDKLYHNKILSKIKKNNRLARKKMRK